MDSAIKIYLIILFFIFLIMGAAFAIIHFGNKIGSLLYWRCAHSKKVGLSFNQFLKFWQLNPNHWELGRDHITYEKRTGVDRMGFPIYAEYSVVLSKKDRVKYKRFFDNRENTKRIATENKTTAEFIRLVQEDLNEFCGKNPVYENPNEPGAKSDWVHKVKPVSPIKRPHESFWDDPIWDKLL